MVMKEDNVGVIKGVWVGVKTKANVLQGKPKAIFQKNLWP